MFTGIISGTGKVVIGWGGMVACVGMGGGGSYLRMVGARVGWGF